MRTPSGVRRSGNFMLGCLPWLGVSGASAGGAGVAAGTASVSVAGAEGAAAGFCTAAPATTPNHYWKGQEMSTHLPFGGLRSACIPADMLSHWHT